jgi:hypothetical protein
MMSPAPKYSVQLEVVHRQLRGQGLLQTGPIRRDEVHMHALQMVRQSEKGFPYSMQFWTPIEQLISDA